MPRLAGVGNGDDLAHAHSAVAFDLEQPEGRSRNFSQYRGGLLDHRECDLDDW